MPAPTPFAADLAVIYGPPFGAACARRRSDGDALFAAIFGTTDALVLEGYAVTADYSLRYPTDSIDLDQGDTVIVGCDTDDDGAAILVDGRAQGGTAYRVKGEPRRLNDGSESRALLSGA